MAAGKYMKVGGGGKGEKESRQEGTKGSRGPEGCVCQNVVLDLRVYQAELKPD